MRSIPKALYSLSSMFSQDNRPPNVMIGVTKGHSSISLEVASTYTFKSVD